MCISYVKKCFICLLYSYSLKYFNVFTFLCNIFISIKMRLSYFVDYGIKYFYQIFLGTCLFLFYLKCVIIIFFWYMWKDTQSLRVKFNRISFEENNVHVYRFFIRTVCSCVLWYFKKTQSKHSGVFFTSK